MKWRSWTTHSIRLLEDSAFFPMKNGKSLVQKGIRIWRDIHDMKAGSIEMQIDLAIRQNPTVLLVLSKHSLNSDWVQHEVRKARELETAFYEPFKRMKKIIE
jgi:hypothetical protein